MGRGERHGGRAGDLYEAAAMPVPAHVRRLFLGDLGKARTMRGARWGKARPKHVPPVANADHWSVGRISGLARTVAAS